jgi:hypothetical protein
MASTNELHFFNHASFAIERDSEILLIDPWYEGTAFNNGWALIDGSTSNSYVIEWLKKTNKKIFIWYSHEHSDHLSISFLKSISKEKINIKIIFQKTLDGRVRKFLNELGLNVIDAKDGIPISLGARFEITTWPYIGGDSFCLIKTEEISLLNINDCVISNESQAQLVKKKYSRIAPRIDILFTQFGYANWVGNESDREQRIKLANHKFDRIYIQNKVFCPSFIIPFASFAFFCHKENFYLNDEQNSPEDLLMAKQLQFIKEKIFFLKPRDKISLSSDKLIKSQFENLLVDSVIHWSNLKKTINHIESQTKEVESKELKGIYLSYRKKMSICFVFLPQIFEALGVIKQIKILIIDLNTIAVLSYINGIKFEEKTNDWEISLTSEVFYFIFKNEFGFSTTHVNGRFRLGSGKNIFDVAKFFVIQDYYKQGYGISNPVKSTNYFVNSVLRFLTKRLYK